MTQEEAQRRCAALGATLAEVRENSILSNLKAWYSAGSKRLWTGITDKSEVGATFFFLFCGLPIPNGNWVEYGGQGRVLLTSA